MAERHSRMLNRLAELSLALAEAVQETALAAEAPEDQARLAHAFGRAAHAVRQSVALEAKLTQDAARAQDARESVEAGRRAARRERQAGQLRLSVGRVVAEQARGFERENQLRELDRLVTEGQLFDDFADAPLEAQIARLCDHLALDPEEVAEASPFLADTPADMLADAPADAPFADPPPLRDTG